jgi:excisionase family DNA binding protein
MRLSLSIEEVVEFTGIGKTKIYEAINSGQLQAKKFGKKTIILMPDLESFLNSLSNYPLRIS